VSGAFLRAGAAVAASLAASGALAACTVSGPVAPPGAAGPEPAGSAVPAAGSSMPAAATPRAQVAGGNARACAAAPSALVGAALGLPVGRVVGTVEGPVTVCAYPGAHEVIVRFQRGENAAQFAAYRSATGAMHQVITPVTGLGGGAYLATYTLTKPPANTLAARRGPLAIFITSPAALGAERRLMARLLRRS
jgi:hypothetical protein